MSRIARLAILICFLGALSACAGMEYVRTWVYDGVELTDTLLIAEHSFRLQRASPKGTSVFSGRLAERGDEWMFSIESWEPNNAAAQRFDPPVIYIYRARRFQNGLAFYSYRVEGDSPLSLFIRAPSDFSIRE